METITLEEESARGKNIEKGEIEEERRDKRK